MPIPIPFFDFMFAFTSKCLRNTIVRIFNRLTMEHGKGQKMFLRTVTIMQLNEHELCESTVHKTVYHRDRFRSPITASFRFSNEIRNTCYFLFSPPVMNWMNYILSCALSWEYVGIANLQCSLFIWCEDKRGTIN